MGLITHFIHVKGFNSVDTPRLLFLENDVVLDPENKKAYWYIFNVSTLIELCKSPVELLFHLIRRTNLKEFIL